MTATIGLVLDCTDPTELARFWSEALGYTTLGGASNYVMLVDPDTSDPSSSSKQCPSQRPSRTACTSTSRSPTSRTRQPASRRSAHGELRRAFAASTGSNW